METVTRGPEHGDGYVLLVDDDADIRETVEYLLSSYGHRVTAMADGREAFGWLTSGRPPPCLVLLDLMMPGMSGFELRSLMTREPSLATIPVVVLTGAGAQADRRSAELQAPVLRKPVSLAQLLQTVDQFCGRPQGEN